MYTWYIKGYACHEQRFMCFSTKQKEGETRGGREKVEKEEEEEDDSVLSHISI